MKQPSWYAQETDKLMAAATNRALLAAFRDPAWVGVLDRAAPEHRSYLTVLHSEVQKAQGLLTSDQLELIDRVRGNHGGVLTVQEGRDILAALQTDLHRENRREIVAELRAGAVSTAAVDHLRTATLDWDGLLDQPEQTPLINGVLTEGALAVLIGAQGIGKSFLSLAWCLCVSTGLPWLGRPVRQQRVLYVIGEGAYGLRQRAESWVKEAGVVPGPEDFRVLPAPGRLDDPRNLRTLAKMAADDGAGLVVLDTLSSVAPEAEKPDKAPAFLAELKTLREGLPGRGTVLFVHHSGVASPDRARNSTALEANPDEVLVLTASGENSPLLTLKGKKVKDAPDGWSIPLRRTVLGASCVIEKMPGGKPPSGAQEADAHPLADHPVCAETAGWADRIRNHLVSVGSAGETTSGLLLATGAEDKRSSFYKARTALIASGDVVKVGRRHYLAEHAPKTATSKAAQ
jgi:hypothetical protein